MLVSTAQARAQVMRRGAETTGSESARLKRFDNSLTAVQMSRRSPSILPTAQKKSGAYYTPDPVVASLVHWAVRNEADRLLDPSCGDGRFIRTHRNSVGIEQDPSAASQAISVAPWALIHEGDFFTWARNTEERFECAAGNPPFIRYQTFKGETREGALRYCASLGAQFSGLTSSWAPFLVATASLLKPGGRMSFVVPAEIGHAPYASPLLEYMIAKFRTVHVVAVRDKLFPDLSEDCWLLHAEGFGGSTDEIRFSVLESFRHTKGPPRQFARVGVHEWRTIWNRRLRPYILPEPTRDLYQMVAGENSSRRLGQLARVGIGYVSGANDFFHLRPRQAADLGIPKHLLHLTVRNGRALPSKTLTPNIVKSWIANDDPVLLLKLPKLGSVPAAVRRYLETDDGYEARQAYKCRVRSPWYSVPDVQVPDFFLSYMSGREASLVRNSASATCTNSVHSVRLKDKRLLGRLNDLWDTPFVQLSCELEGHPLGGGMLKLEPREASQVLLPAASLLAELPGNALEDAISTMQQWRHYAAAA